MKRWPLPNARRFVVLLTPCLAASLAACGDDDPGSGYEESCARTCARQHQCLSSIDEETCTNSCVNRLANVGDHLRPDYVAGIDRCTGDLSCDQLVVATLTESCASEARASLAASRSALALCDMVSASVDECGGATRGAAGCIDTVKVFTDVSLRSALTCSDVRCDQRADCVAEALGLSLLGS